MAASIPIGIDSFRELRELHLEYIDKTRLIQDLLDDAGTKVLLLPRPRRFGKTVNLTMLEAFFARSSEDLSPLFEGLHIWTAGEAYRAHFQRYPTVFMSLKNVKPKDEAEWKESVRFKLSGLFGGYLDLPERAGMSPTEREDFAAVLERRASDVLLYESLLLLSGWLHRAYGEQVIILIDEYDTPIHAAWKNGCYAPVVDFFRAFFGAALKGNPHLYRSVLTGILRVSKESIFSDLNNIKVKTVLDGEFCDVFGFTEEEVRTLCERQGQLEHLATLQTWYNGYRFGGKVMYNPWSVLNFLDSRDKTPQAYWLTSSSNDLIKELITRHALQVHGAFQTLLEGGSVQRKIEPNLVFPELERNVDALFTLLLFSGYLKAERLPTDPMQRAEWALSIPNLEVLEMYRTTFQGWLEAALGGYGEQTQHLVKAILTGDEARFEALLGRLAQRVLSFHDTAFDPEALYHGLMLGLCATLEPKYRVRSNRESGTGRPDLLILPSRPGQAGAVLELKVATPAGARGAAGAGGRRRGRTMKQALAEAVAQLERREYVAELEAAGAAPIQRWAVAFDGKRVRVAWVGEPGA